MASQWQAFTDKIKTEGDLLFAGLYDHQGNVWGTTGDGCGTRAVPAEIASLVSVIRDKSHYEDGVKLGGLDFMVCNVFDFDNTCVMKRKNLPADASENDKLEVVVALTGQACIVGISAGGKGKGGQLKKAVCETQNYLIETKY